VYCVCFNSSGHVLIKREPGKLWNLPGGTVEHNETPIQTLERELEEEVDVVVGDNKMIGYYKVVSSKPTIYQLRFAAMIHKLNTQTKDPDIDLINERKLVKPNEFFDYVKIENYHPMLDEAVKWFEKNKLLR